MLLSKIFLCKCVINLLIEKIFTNFDLYLQSSLKILSLPSQSSCNNKEVRWVSGLNHQFAKLTYGKLYRGFESLPHRRKNNYTGCSSVRLECLVWDQEVVGSNPAIPTNQVKSLTAMWGFFVFLTIDFIDGLTNYCLISH